MNVDFAHRPPGGGVRAAAEGAQVRLDRDRGTDDTAGAGRVWQDGIDLLGADPLLSYGEGHLVGRPAATARSTLTSTARASTC